MHVAFQIRVFSGYMPKSGIAGSYGNSSFSFYLFSIVAAPIYIPTNSVGDLLFSIPSLAFTICSLITQLAYSKAETLLCQQRSV